MVTATGPGVLAHRPAVVGHRRLGGRVFVADDLARAPSPQFRGAALVVRHLSSRFPSRLPELLARRVWLPVKTAENGESLEAGTIYVAPPDRHMTVVDGHTTLSLDDIALTLRRLVMGGRRRSTPSEAEPKRWPPAASSPERRG